MRRKIQAADADAPPVTDLAARLELRSQITQLEQALDAALSLHEIPPQLCQAMRAPAGSLHDVTLDVDDYAARVIVHPLGLVDPTREVAVWNDLMSAATYITPGQQLRTMEPAIAAVQIGTARMVNTGQPRPAARAAIRMLRYNSTLPAAIAWLWARARKHATQSAGKAAAVAATTAAVTISTVALAATLISRETPPEIPPASNQPALAHVVEDPEQPVTGGATSPTPTPRVELSPYSPPPTQPGFRGLPRDQGEPPDDGSASRPESESMTKRPEPQASNAGPSAQPSREPSTAPSANHSTTPSLTPSATSTPSPTRSTTPTPSPTRSATPTPSPTRSATPTPSPTRSATPTPSPTRSATPTPSPKPSHTHEPSPTTEPTATHEPSPTTEPTPTHEPSPTTEPTPTHEPSPTPSSSPSCLIFDIKLGWIRICW
ncbi:hypothetical protein [Microtetraspora malaysiensis]|uniref:Uncharacterized protein n=1 Tax=Microtetraspora malaysiensis TaxID=161358 RepID=A0ABW6SKH3_9ACTN